ncbi:MAG: LamG domain-containing protein, partial [Sedimentisphaerales bacterium]
MSKKSIYLVSFVLVLGLVLTSVAGAADPDLIGWWPLNEGSGDIAIDLSGSGNDGTINNAASGGLGSGGSVWVNDPEHGMVISFNGNDSSGAVVITDLIIPFMSMDNDFTWAFWAKQHADQATDNDTILGNRYGGTTSPLQFIKFTPTRFEFYNDDGSYSEGINYTAVPGGVWVHHVIVKDGKSLTYYRNGEEAGTNTISKTIDENPFYMGADATAEHWQGYMSDVRLYTKALTVLEILGVMEGTGEVWPYASSPTPRDDTLHKDTWVNISWRPGGRAVSHDVYLGDNFDDVNAGAEGTFRGNQATTFFVAGFPGFPYPDGLVPGTTYYWRIDEVNELNPDSPWKGDVWSFSIPPKTAYSAKPADGAELVATDVKLSWTGGFGAKLHTVYFGDNFDNVNNATGGLPQGTMTYNPGPLKSGKTYYWRVDEFDIIDT